MFKHILLIIFILSASKLYSQEPLAELIKDGKFQVSKEVIKEAIANSSPRLINFTDTLNRFAQVTRILVKPNSLNTNIDFDVNENSFLFYILSKDMKSENTKSLSLDMREKLFRPFKISKTCDNLSLLGIPLEGLVALGYENIYWLKLFPQKISEEKKYLCWINKNNSSTDEILIMDENIILFSSLKQLLEYNFVSIGNYIETYRKRESMQEVLGKIRRNWSIDTLYDGDASKFDNTIRIR